MAILFPTTAYGLYEDQAGQSDWYQQHIGGISHAEFAFKSRERIFLATESNVVASLDLRDGSIAWRQVLAESDSVEAVALLPKPAAFASLSSGGRHLRLWQAHDGGLLWEQLVETKQQSQPQNAGAQLLVLPDVTGDGASELAVFANGGLQVQTLMHALLKTPLHRGLHVSRTWIEQGWRVP